MRSEGLPPVVSENARILILGTLPGKQSLAMQKYYDHPGNAFWKVMEKLIGVKRGMSYQERINQLKNARIALWDVFKECEREGSTDTGINKGTEETNDFETFLNKYTGIQRIYFNGKKPEKAFRRRVWRKLPQSIQSRLALATLPSTSPTNTHLTEIEKVGEWCRSLEDLIYK